MAVSQGREAENAVREEVRKGMGISSGCQISQREFTPAYFTSYLSRGGKERNGDSLGMPDITEAVDCLSIQIEEYLYSLTP